METNKKPNIKRALHPRFVAIEVYMAHPDIVGVKNPNVSPAREVGRINESKPLSADVVRISATFRRRF